MKKKSISSNGSKTGFANGNTAATRKPGKTGATGIIKKTDRADRPVRTGKTGPTGIIRETGTNGMEAPGGSENRGACQSSFHLPVNRKVVKNVCR